MTCLLWLGYRPRRPRPELSEGYCANLVRKAGLSRYLIVIHAEPRLSKTANAHSRPQAAGHRVLVGRPSM